MCSTALCWGARQGEAVNLSNLQWGNAIVPCKYKECVFNNLLNNVLKSLKQSEEGDTQLRRQLIALNVYRQVAMYNCNTSFLWLVACRYWYPSRFTIDANVFQLLLASMSIFLVTEDHIWVTVDVIQLGCIWNTWFLKKIVECEVQQSQLASGPLVQYSLIQLLTSFVGLANSAGVFLSLSFLLFYWKRIGLANARDVIKDPS